MTKKEKQIIIAYKDFYMKRAISSQQNEDKEKADIFWAKVISIQSLMDDLKILDE